MRVSGGDFTQEVVSVAVKVWLEMGETTHARDEEVGEQRSPKASTARSVISTWLQLLRIGLDSRDDDSKSNPDEHDPQAEPSTTPVAVFVADERLPLVAPVGSAPLPARLAAEIVQLRLLPAAKQRRRSKHTIPTRGQFMNRSREAKRGAKGDGEA